MKNFGSFFREVKIELSKVVWPPKDEFVGSIIVVMLVLVAFTVFFGVINQVFQVCALKGFRFLSLLRS